VFIGGCNGRASEKKKNKIIKNLFGNNINGLI
jgi:hypothetical protein